MHRVRSPAGITVSYDRYGSGPGILLVHGAFSDHRTNWEFVREPLENRFTRRDDNSPGFVRGVGMSLPGLT